ncbi:unnamed protein product [Caenorhabditis angaria]|uniref:Phospholipid scramblase n=1 Tax=Caenorhabditis angaria TaxID=860376 RepID=A0A9P1N2U7_9PELO|nr:unnamed protein product [Caenorhabditis angaria]
MAHETREEEIQPSSSPQSPAQIEVQNPIRNVPYDLPNIPLPRHGALDVIQMTNALIVVQSMETIEILTGFETQNRYVVKDMFMRPILYAFERSNGFRRNFSGNRRDFTMEFADIYGAVIMKGRRSLICCSDEFKFQYPVGQTIGTITMEGCDHSFYVHPSVGPRFMAQTPCCSCGDSHFPVVLSGGGKVGEIVRLYPGYFKGMISDADTFMVHFNSALPVYHKLLMMATVFLMDFVYFEDNDRRRRR